MHTPEKKTSHHLCIAVAGRRRLGSYPKVLGQASLQLRTPHLGRIVAVDHKLDEGGIGTVRDAQSDLTADGGEVAEENAIEHENGGLANPVLGRGALSVSKTS